MRYDYQVGVGKADITPSTEVYISGDLYPRKYEVVNDPLHVRAMLIKWGETEVLFLSFDIVGLTELDMEKIREKVTRTYGISQEKLICFASHSHYGPYTSSFFELVKPTHFSDQNAYEHACSDQRGYLDFLSEAAVKVVGQAFDTLEDCKIGHASGHVPDVSHNRRMLKNGNDCWNTWLLTREERQSMVPEGPIDPALPFIAAINRAGKVKAVLYNFALHMCNSPLRSISADFHGVVEHVIQESLGTDTIVLFSLGTCGNINSDFGYDLIGQKLGQEIIRMLEQLQFGGKRVLQVEKHTIQLEHRKVTEFEQREEIERKWPRGLSHFSEVYEYYKGKSLPPQEVDMWGVRLGDAVIVSNPAELFVQDGFAIKEGSPFQLTMVSTLTNGMIGYIPSREAFEHGGYETFLSHASKFEKDASGKITDAMRALIQQLAD